MDLHLTSEQTLLRDSAAKFIAAAGPKVARGFRDRDPSFAPARLRQAGELGWLGILVPPSMDGLGLGLTELAERERRRRCEPLPVPHEGKDDAHNRCADQFPPNRYPGMDVLVDGVSFDALQVGARALWEIKTHQFDTYKDFVRRREIDKEMKQFNKQRNAAAACGYDFFIGVSTQAHKDELLQRDQFLDIVVTGCTR